VEWRGEGGIFFAVGVRSVGRSDPMPRIESAPNRRYEEEGIKSFAINYRDTVSRFTSRFLPRPYYKSDTTDYPD